MAASDIEALPLGGKTLLRSRTSGACVLSNDDGLAILEGVRRGQPEASLAAVVAQRAGVGREAATGMLRATLRAWEVAGLLADAVPRPEAACRPDSGDRDRHASAFVLEGRACRIRTPHEVLRRQIDAVLRAYRVEDLPDGGDLLQLEGDWGDFRLFRNGVCVAAGLDHDQLRHLALREAIAALAGRERVAALIHAACVARDGRCLVLPGTTGAGKTTLALALAGAGWRQVADDLVPLARDGGSVIAVPAAASVKRARAEADPGPDPDLGALLGLEHRLPRNPAVAGSVLRVSAIVFPQFLPGVAPSLDRLSAEDAFVALLRTGTDLLSISDSAAPLAALANGVPAYRIAYPDTATAMRACSSLDGPRGG